MQKQHILLCTTALLALLGTSVRAAQIRKNTQHTTAKVIILGVAHLEAKNDVHNSVFEDSPLSPKRQKQVADIISRLSKFHPTKVLIEAPMGDPKYAERYQQFLAGRYSLPANEIYQFGFKLAARSKNSTVYPIDTYGPTLVEEDSPTDKRHTEFLKAHFAQVSTPAFKEVLARSNALERSGSYLVLAALPEY